jgi:hypothetical protein
MGIVQHALSALACVEGIVPSSLHPHVCCPACCDHSPCSCLPAWRKQCLGGALLAPGGRGWYRFDAPHRLLLSHIRPPVKCWQRPLQRSHPARPGAFRRVSAGPQVTCCCSRPPPPARARRPAAARNAAASGPTQDPPCTPHFAAMLRSSQAAHHVHSWGDVHSAASTTSHQRTQHGLAARRAHCTPQHGPQSRPAQQNLS